MQMSLSAVARSLTGAIASGGDCRVHGVGSDTRTLQPGELFVALRGQRFDGHLYVGEARHRGAAAVMVSREVVTDLPRVQVPDTRVALGELAAHWRAGFEVGLVAVTGSTGKTTVKEMLASILGSVGSVLATRGNLNNDIGVPLTLLRLDSRHRHAVIEMGANHPGEIAYLTDLAKPQVALITNAGPAHLEGFGSLDGVVQAKGEIYAGLASEGTAVINADDPSAEVWRGLARRYRRLEFGVDARAEVRASKLAADSAGTDFELHIGGRQFQVRLGLPGRHNVYNALAAAAGAAALGIGTEHIGAGLERVAPVAGRTRPQRGRAGALIIDDTYNANPGSLQAGLDLLASHEGERLLVLGDMAELGAAASAYHAQAGKEARARGIDGLYTVGELAALAAEAFGDGGLSFESTEAVCAALRGRLHEGMTVLVKGSRCMHLERVVDGLLADGER